MRKIAVLYESGNVIKEVKTKVYNLLRERLVDPGRQDAFETNEMIIYWICIRKRNIKKFKENYQPDRIINIEENRDIDLYEELVKEVEEIYSQKAIYYTPCYHTYYGSADSECYGKRLVIAKIKFDELYKPHDINDMFYFATEKEAREELNRRVEDSLPLLIDNINGKIERLLEDLEYADKNIKNNKWRETAIATYEKLLKKMKGE